MPNFAQHVETAVNSLLSGRFDDVDYNDFVYAAQLVFDGVRDIRRAVLMNRVSQLSGYSCVFHTLLFCVHAY